MDISTKADYDFGHLLVVDLFSPLTADQVKEGTNADSVTLIWDSAANPTVQPSKFFLRIAHSLSRAFELLEFEFSNDIQIFHLTGSPVSSILALDHDRVGLLAHVVMCEVQYREFAYCTYVAWSIREVQEAFTSAQLQHQQAMKILGNRRFSHFPAPTLTAQTAVELEDYGKSELEYYLCQIRQFLTLRW